MATYCKNKDCDASTMQNMNGEAYECDQCWQKKKDRLEYLRGEIEAEHISTAEIAELQSLAEYIEPGDVQLLEWAGVPENK